MEQPTSIVELAREFATSRHAGKMYNGKYPYIKHLEAVDNVGMRFGDMDDIDRCINWLHDIIEDTNTTYEELEDLFGHEVAEAVDSLSEPSGGNRKWRHAQTYPKIRNNHRALCAKLRDRIANVEAGGKLQMYQKEHESFKAALYHLDDTMPNTCVVSRMWAHLDSLI